VLATVGFIVSMFLTMVLTPPLIRVALALGVVDIPDARKVHATPIPRIGGVAMIIGTLVSLILWAPYTPQVLWFVAGVTNIAAFGLWDDRVALDYRIKFLGQLLSIACVVFGAGLQIKFLPFLGNGAELPDWFSLPFSVFALLGIINAINLSDGLDGLAGGASFISIASMALLAYLLSDSTLLLLCAATLGGIVGFLRFNTHPAQIFMGDAGSQFLGFTAGVLVIMLTQYSTQVMSPFVALLLLGLPILDTMLVMGQRIAEGRSPFKPDKTHIHHRLLQLNFDHYEAVVIIYLLQSVMVISAVLLRFEQDWINGLWFVGFCGAVVIAITRASRSGWRAHSLRNPADDGVLQRWLTASQENGLLYRRPLLFVSLAVPALLMLRALQVTGIPADTSLVLLGMWAIGFVALVCLRGKHPIGLLDRLLACTTIIATLYYGSTASLREFAGVFSAENLLYGFVAVSIVLIYRFAPRNPFRITTMDFLVVFAVMVIPNVMSLMSFREHLGEIAAKSLVLYYGVEVLIAHFEQRRFLLRAVSTSLLGILVVHMLYF
jgi:UDP-GlcNAc:undecaprenyl-phosphate GlcNAc-1-phosphate transferase